VIYQTTIAATLILATSLIAVPRKYFLMPFILAACFIPADQRIIILDLDFTPLRILVVAGVLRLLLREEVRKINWNRFDKLVLLWAVVGAGIYVLQWRDMRALIYKCGVLFDVIGLYWLFRQNIHSWHDIIYPFKVMAVCCLVLVPFVAYERVTGSNPFVVLGRVETWTREGTYRCQASFPHSIMLGLFWATVFPFFTGLYRIGRPKCLYGAAAAASVFIVVATASSTPLMALFYVVAGLYWFKWRRYTGTAGWGVAASLIGLHIVMEAPVWHLISRIRLIGGSTGWHRYHLIDEAVNHFDEWALIGCRSTSHWGWNLYDVTNQFVLEGVRGGFVTFLLFLAMIYVAFRTLLHLCLRCQEHTHRILTWCLFVVLLGHCVAFFGVSYFGQITMWWYMTLAMVGFLSEGYKCKEYAATINLLPNWANAAGR